MTEVAIQPVMPLGDHAWALLEVAWHLRDIAACELDLDAQHGYALLIRLPVKERVTLWSTTQDGHQCFQMLRNGSVWTVAYDAQSEVAAKALLGIYNVPPPMDLGDGSNP